MKMAGWIRRSLTARRVDEQEKSKVAIPFYDPYLE